VPLILEDYAGTLSCMKSSQLFLLHFHHSCKTNSGTEGLRVRLPRGSFHQ